MATIGHGLLIAQQDKATQINSKERGLGRNAKLRVPKSRQANQAGTHQKPTDEPKIDKELKPTRTKIFAEVLPA